MRLPTARWLAINDAWTPGKSRLGTLPPASPLACAGRRGGLWKSCRSLPARQWIAGLLPPGLLRHLYIKTENQVECGTARASTLKVQADCIKMAR